MRPPAGPLPVPPFPPRGRREKRGLRRQSAERGCGGVYLPRPCSAAGAAGSRRHRQRIPAVSGCSEDGFRPRPPAPRGGVPEGGERPGLPDGPQSPVCLATVPSASTLSSGSSVTVRPRATALHLPPPAPSPPRLGEHAPGTRLCSKCWQFGARGWERGRRILRFGLQFSSHFSFSSF